LSYDPVSGILIAYNHSALEGAATICAECLPGTSSSIASTTCHCPAGQSLAGTPTLRCYPCVFSTYSNESTGWSCAICPTGTTPNALHDACIP
jgi:hypothetical protein